MLALIVAAWWLVSRRASLPTPLASADLTAGVSLAVEGVQESDGGARRFELRHASGAHFFVSLGAPRALPDSSFAMADGSLERAPDSAPEGLLQALAAAHDGSFSSRAESRGRLDIDVGVLGENLSRGSGNGLLIAGEFWSEPLGPWTVLKLFVPGGDEPAELFLAVNPTAGTAEFLAKDSMYWDTMAPVLAGVL